jgi:UDP-2,4-diacetamido-2,4,6-trideoxy-beta-L-altropyranose hydrolase
MDSPFPSLLFAPAAGPGIGGGHVMRCLTLAEALRVRGVGCVFAVNEAGRDLIHRFGPENTPMELIGSIAELPALAARVRPKGVVLDNYSLDAAIEAPLRADTGLMVVLDDLANRPHAADLLLDPSFGRLPADYAALAPGAMVLAGPDYALVRSSFAALRQTGVCEMGLEVQRIFVSFGLSDIDGVAGRTVQLLLSLAPRARLEVVLASDAISAPGLAQLSPLEPRLSLHLDAKDVAPIMADCDLSIGAGGSGVWERATLGLPGIIVIVADNQRDLAHRLHKDGYALAVELNDPGFDQALSSAFEALKGQPLRRQMQADLMALCDGRGAERVAAEIVQRF